MTRSVVVFSGGLDSSTCLGLALEESNEVFPITYHYGQRHSREVEQAKQIVSYYGLQKHHHIALLDFLNHMGGSALTDTNIEIPTMGVGQDIPITYVPARNLIFLAVAAAYAERVEAQAIYIGVSSVDYSGYPDCRPQFISSMAETIQLGTKTGQEKDAISIKTPLILLNKADTVKLGMSLKVPYHLTTSCYRGEEAACGLCDSCRLRIKGFKEAGYRDPIPYKIPVIW
jgi:7-cyano-7-deazaguanine synthase